MNKALLLYATNFLAAFLLFQIELIIAKSLLPLFGGSYLVWGSCVVFFQAVLLAGYIYVHVLFHRAGPLKRLPWHLAIILLPLLFFPGRVLPEIHPHQNWPMVLDIFAQLSMTIGVVFFALSTISLSTQTWLAASDLPQKRNPYPLYAVSNAGSLLGLLSYPFLFEYFWDIDKQILFWRIGYLVLLAFYMASFVLIKVANKPPPVSPLHLSPDRPVQPSLAAPVKWLLLSTAASTLVLAVTHIITYEIAPSPLFWIVPLSLYLLSFVLVFREKPFCPLWLRDNIHLVLGAALLLFLLIPQGHFPVFALFVTALVLLFLLCLYCQYELYVSRPAKHRDLTLFYLILSLGGFCGGILTTWIAPVAFSFSQEYLCGLLLISLSIPQKNGVLGWRKLSLVTVLMVIFLLSISFFPVWFPLNKLFNLVTFLLITAAVISGLKEYPRIMAFILLLTTVLWPAIYFLGKPSIIYIKRNYYGTYKVERTKSSLALLNGTISHGIQYTSPERRNIPTSYYHAETAVGRILGQEDFQPKKIAIIGLGAGTIAAYGRSGQNMDFYELDPDVHVIAKDFFYFLKDSPAKMRHIVGDARIQLTRSRELYDLIIIDAFSGDSIPAHLLTQEAFKDYQARLSFGGVLLVHTSNKYLDVTSLVSQVIQKTGGFPVIAHSKGSKDGFFSSTWVLACPDKDTQDRYLSRFAWKDALKDPDIKNIRPWTDNYSSITGILLIKNFINKTVRFDSWQICYRFFKSRHLLI